MTNQQALASPRRWIKRLIPAVLLLNLGCAKMGGSSNYADYARHGDVLPEAQTISVTGAARPYDYRADGEYDFADDLAEGSKTTAADAALFGSRAKEKLSEAYEDAPPARTKPGEPSTKAIADEQQGKAEPGEPAIAKPDKQNPDHGRQIIYVAGMQISVYSRESAMATVEALPDKLGGWIHMRNENQVVLRLPAHRLKPAMAQLSTLGVVEARTLQAQDVTAEYVDLESRIKVMRETQTQLLELLGKAKTVEEALHVRKALDQVTMELEVALGRMRQLADLIAYSTLTVTLVERGPQDHIPTSNDPFRWVDSLGVEATEWR
jgi:hypothetical protein